MKKILSLIIVVAISATSTMQVFAAPTEVSRKQFVKEINRLFHISSALGMKEDFKDVVLADNPEDYIQFTAANEKGYMSGYSDGTVKPDAAISRAEAAAAMSRLMELPQPMDGPLFQDNEAIPGWAMDSTQRVVARGILNADADGKFNPRESLTSDELDEAVSVIESLGLQGREDSVETIKSFDGYTITGRLSVPAGEEKIDKLVIFVHGTGPNSYEMQRGSAEMGMSFKYLDYYADGFTNDGTAFFTYNTRGVDLGYEAPYYATIDESVYSQYTPQNIAQDVTYMIKALKEDPRFKEAKIFLLGASEGTVIAPLAVKEYGAEADVLLLAGYCNDNMKDVLEYQLGGGMSFFNYTVLFDAVGEEKITKEIFEADVNEIIEDYLGGVAFEDIDSNKDGFLTEEDFATLMGPIKDGLFQAVEAGDDAWIKENMAVIMPPLLTTWFKGHFSLPKTEDIMTEVDIPMYIFQGTYDANCPVQGTYDVQARFKELGKKNLTVNIYEGYNHDLNFTNWIYGAGSEAFDDIFETVKQY